MAVNSMTKEQAYTLINAIHAQATGSAALAATDTSDFVSVAQATLAAGYENTLNAITQVLQRTIVAVRPYDAKFTGLEFTEDTWGGIIRKLNFVDTGSEYDPTHATVNGASIDQYVVKKPVLIETRYVGSDTYMGSYTIYKTQLATAFSDVSNFSAFMTGLMTHFLNERTQWLENLKRMILCNAIAGIVDANGTVIHLLTEYNADTNLNLSATDVMQPANFKPFMQWCYARVSELSRMMSERSELFQLNITGYPIMRHTPVQDQRIYMDAKFLDQMDAMVLADTYHDNFLRYADVEGVSYWQAIQSPRDINIKPVYIDASGAVNVASGAVSVTDVVGIMFDRDALGYNIYRDSLDASPYNAKGQYYNIFAHMDIQLQNDFTEKIIVLKLD